ncbi:MAG: restriction endonuclease subunit S [Ferruginibacter sp.]
MSKEKKNRVVPQLRFPEFSKIESWEQTTISDLLDYERPDNYIVSDTNYQKSGIPVLTANKSFILGYTSEEDGIYENIPAIIFDDFTVDKKFVDFPFKVKSSAIKILKAKEGNNLRFIFDLISQIKFEAKEHKRYYISAYQNLAVNIPKPAEQQKIASCLSSLDDLITAHTQKLDALKTHKKGLMQQLFPAEGEKVPKLRFKEFEGSGEWEGKKLGDEDVSLFVNKKFSGKLTIENYISTENILPDCG